LQRKQQLLQHFEQIHNNNDQLVSKDYNIKSFVKREFYQEPKILRFINARTDNFKVKVVPYIRLIESQFFDSHYFIKHKDIMGVPLLIDKFSHFKFFLQTDYSSFESGFSPEYTDNVECELFRYMLKNNPEILNDVLKVYYTIKDDIICPRCEKIIAVNGQYRFSTIGTRMSGEMWTSLANSFSNLMNILFLCEQKHIEVDGIVEGDDGLFGLSNNSLTSKDFENLGFKIKFKYLKNIDEADFCSIYYEHVNKLAIIGPHCISNLSWNLHTQYCNCKHIKTVELLLAKSMSLYCLGKYTPIAAVLSVTLINYIKKNFPKANHNNVKIDRWWYNERLFKQLEKLKDDFPIKVTQEARQFYATRFKISIADQLLIEKQIIESPDPINFVSDIQLNEYSNEQGLSYLD